MYVKSLLAAALSACVLFAAPAHADALHKPGCEPQLSVTTLPFEPREDFTKGFAGIQALTQQSSHELTRAGQGVGATRVAISAKNDTTTDAQGCPVLNIAVGYANPVVYIASELGRNECAQRHVLEHERHHVALYRESLETLAERVRVALLPKLAGAFADEKSEAAVKALLEASMDEAQRVMPLHHAFDSEEEYDRNESACDGAIKSLFKRWQRMNR